MQQRQLRLGDILDDYCPRERRLTNHAVVAMVGDEVKQTRCTTCDAEHEFKHAKVPRQRRKTDSPAALQAQVLAGRRAETGRRARRARSNLDDGPLAPRPPVDAAAPVPQPRRRRARRCSMQPDAVDLPPSRRRARRRRRRRWHGREDGPAHRRLIRATLPRQEGQQPPARPAPDFTIRQPAAGRPNRFRPRHQRGGQPFQGNRSNSQGGPTLTGMPRQGNARSADGLAARQAARSRAQALEMIAAQPAPPMASRPARRQRPWTQALELQRAGRRPRQRHGKPCRKARAHCWCRQQAIDFVGHRAGGRRGGRPAGADLSRPSGSKRTSASWPRRWSNPLVLPCDVVERSSRSPTLAATVDREFGGLDFLVHGAAFAPQAELSNPFVQTSREGFRIALDVSAYSLIALDARGRAADGAARRRQHSDADLSRQPARLHQLQRHGRGQGGARVVGPLSGQRSRPAEHPRQRHLRRTDQDAGGGRHLGLLEHPAGLPRPRAAAPQRRARRGRRHRAVPARSRRRAPSPAR